MEVGSTDTSISVLADPTRARILGIMRDAEDGRVLVGGLADVLELRQPTVSHHMKVLRDEGVVIGVREGRRVWYSISPDLRERVDALLGDASDAAYSKPDLARITRDLAQRYAGVLSPETVANYVDESYRLLTERGDIPKAASRTATFASQRLENLLRQENELEGKPEVLFVCVQNVGRSQMAAAILQQLAGDRVVVRTAGSEPGRELRSTVVTALDEIGVPIAGEFPKPLLDESVRAADVVVTMGCGDACPVYPGRTYLDWPLDDPEGKPLEDVRNVRDEIDRRIRALLPKLLP